MAGASTFKNADRALRIASLGVAFCALHHFSNASLSDPGRNVIRSFMGLVSGYDSLRSRNFTIAERRWLTSVMSPTWPQLIPSVSGAGQSCRSSKMRSSKSLATRWAFSYAASAVSFGLGILRILLACGLVPVVCRSSSPRLKHRKCRTVCKRSFREYKQIF